MLAHIKDIIADATRHKYAVGAFNIHNLESVLGVAQAAMRAKSPAIIQVSESVIKYMGLKPVTHIVSTVAKNVATGVPIALHLDHGRSFDAVFECINAGFSSVHIDASHLPLDENIALTKHVVELAHQKDVWVQGEVGAIMGGHGAIGGQITDIPIAKMEEVKQFVEATGVDTIAAAIGTAHGVYDNERIIFDLLKDIKRETGLPFILHGGSGVPDEEIKQAIADGVTVINIGSDIKIAFSRTLIATCLANQQETDPRNLLRPTIQAVEDVAFDRMKLFGSADRITLANIET